MTQQQPLSSKALRPITHGRVVAVAFPAFLSGITEPLLSLADVAIVGQLETAGLQGGVALASQIFTFTFWTLGFLRLSTGGYTAQAFGEQNEQRLFAVLWRGLIIAGVGGALLWLLAPLFWFGLNSVMGWQTDLRPSVETYLGIRIWAAPAVLFSYVCFGWLVGHQRTGVVLLLQAFINLTNIAVSAWLVLVLDMGVAGVALGSVIASYAGVALGGLILLRLGIIGRAGRSGLDGIWQRADWLKLFSTNTNFFLRSLAIAVAFLVLFKAADWLDQRGGLDGVSTDTLAVLWQMFGLIVYGMDAFAVAAEAFSGEAVGAGRRDRLLRSTRLVVFWSLVSSVIAAVIFATAGSGALAYITKLPDVLALSRELMPYIYFSGFYMTAAFMLDGIFLGATRAGDMRDSVIAGLVVQTALVLVLVPWLGMHGLLISVVGFMKARGVVLMLRYPALVASVSERASPETKASA